ncbi:class I SAM-dependent methyltransferase [Rhizobium panacihumi]|uniref:class I SAM-dependent methyltransferase n=1 Tax=Rhizobium panacihumi TaxID=2008450 RepID=UPI003D79A365
MDATLRESYIFKDHGVSLEKYIASEEFREISALIDARYQRPVDLFDVGAGNGVCAAAFAIAGHQAMAIEPGNSNIGGIEAIVAMAEAGTRIDQTIKERLRWAQADILTYSSDEKYDVVLCRQALHHFADPYLALNNIANLLKPGGMALFVREHVIFDEEDKQLFLAGHPLQKFYGGENAYRVDEYEDFIEKSGLQLTKTLKFADSPINYEPHKLADIETLSERDIAGRPYTFIALKSPEQ